MASSDAEHDDRLGLTSWQYICEIPEFPLDWSKSALIVIDLQKHQISPEHGMLKRLHDAGLGDDCAYAIERIQNTMIPNVQRLIAAFRENEAPIIQTRCASLRGDGSDQTRRHVAFGTFCRLDSEDAEFYPDTAPGGDDITLTKSGSSLFNSTNAEHILRNMGITTLVMTGVWTNSCVEGATRDAGDLDFDVVLAEDACVAMSKRGHDNALEYLDKNFCFAWSTDEILERFERDSVRGPAVIQKAAASA